MVRLREHYDKVVKSELIKQFNYTNPMEVPKIEKIVLNMGVGEAAQDKKKIEIALSELMAISGQKPVTTKAKKSIAGFKVREGMPLGVKVCMSF